MLSIEKIHYAPDFAKAYRRLPVHIQKYIDKKDALFRKNPFHPSLKTHKLRGPLKNLWSFCINRQYRILFEFLGQKTAIFYDVGTHEIYK